MFLILTSPNWIDLIPCRYGKYSIGANMITLFCYCLLDRICLFSLVENYFYPDLCPDPYEPVGVSHLMFITWCTLASSAVFFGFLSPLVCKISNWFVVMYSTLN